VPANRQSVPELYGHSVYMKNRTYTTIYLLQETRFIGHNHLWTFMSSKVHVNMNGLQLLV
jgi:hypothetical protein